MLECAECHRQVEEGAKFCPYCGTAAASIAAPEEDPLVGHVVNGKFRVEALIGQGGMGKVYRARHLTLDREVVLKMLHRTYSKDAQVVQRFQREARAASRLDHPNSIAVLDFGAAEDGTLFMAMEYVAGKDLGQVVATEFPLSEERIVRIGVQVLSALAEAHAQGVIHRDLKPENVMVVPRRDNPDFVKVLDFGIAKIVTAAALEPKLTQAGLVCGTPEYMSPEQARGANLDARSDLYSMGVLLYQLATGSLPFESETPVGFLTAHLAQTPVPPRLRRPDLGISQGLDAVITRALEKSPDRRFASADEMRTALLALGRGEPRAGPALLPDPRTGSRERRPFWAFVLVMAVAVLGGSVLVVMVMRTSAERRHFARDPDAQVSEGPRPKGEGTLAAGAASLASSEKPAPAPKVPAGQEEEEKTDGARAPAKEEAAPSAADLFRRAEALRARQDVDQAIPLYLLALKRDPGLSEANKKLALCYQLKGDKKRAAERYRKYLASRPRDAERVKAILESLE